MKIVTITLNPAYDLLGKTEQVALGEVNRINTIGFFTGGKGLNVSKVLADLGIKTTVSGFIGEENQADFVKVFQESESDDRFYRVAGKTRTNIKIRENNQQVTDLNFSGFIVTPDDWHGFVAQSLAWAKEFDVVAVGGSLPPGIDIQDFSTWLQQLSQHAKIVLDSSHAAFMAGLVAKPWLVKPNHRELEAWANQPLNSLADIIQAAKRLQTQGVTNVIISLGEKGAIWVTESAVIQAKPPVCQNVVSTVGAGDSMVAGLLYGFYHQLPITQTFQFASAVATLSIQQEDVGVNDKQALEQMIDQVEISILEGSHV